ncbi:MAG: LGFP repeat protein [Methanoregula sp. PtaU1.Bin051]|nr:MAG: LGFP repeat protein [Methanoregula sp. PtaU1.Bin051]
MSEISKKYTQIRGLKKILKKPLGEEMTCSDKVGRYQIFERGAIYWHPEIGVFYIHGPIYTKWLEQGCEQGSLGYPTSDEIKTRNGVGCYNTFQKGRIYWTAESGAWSTDLVSDKALLDQVWANAKPMPEDWIANFNYGEPLPPIFDYLPDINFRRNQGTKFNAGYGCMTHSLLHIVDILKDWEHPYSPAVSWHYAEWFWVNYLIKNKHTPFLAEQADAGFASEGLCHTDGHEECHFENEPSVGEIHKWTDPSLEAIKEADLYRVWIMPDNKFHGVDPNNPGLAVEQIKKLLLAYGPVWAAGNGHAKAIVGYDDLQQRFIILDSYVHPETGGMNITYIPYSNVGAMEYHDISSFSEVISIPSDERVKGRYAYSARICIENNWRGTYTISIGVEGKKPLVVWTSRGRDHKYPLESSKVLAIDVPLPDYAAIYWPPKLSKKWFLRVEDHDRDGFTGTITEFTLARRYINPDCYTLGKFRSETYTKQISAIIPDPTSGPVAPVPNSEYWPSPSPNPNPGIMTVYMDITEKPTLNIHYSISLQTDTTSGFGSKAKLIGKLTKTMTGGIKPMVKKKVELYESLIHPSIKKIDKWLLYATQVTDLKGQFQFELVIPQPIHKPKKYAVAFKDENGQFLASSKSVNV